MITLEVRHSVADFDNWKTAFDGHSDVRKGHGATQDRVYHDGNDVLVLVDFPDAAHAQGFMEDPSLASAMERGGVTGPPTVRLLSEV